ncbi:MAG TPA: hypothetical protein VGT81_04835 [Casimicrobiaceae bacterium]|nr:hypothetical protein [Casimicrobiaceae bacterium]
MTLHVFGSAQKHEYPASGVSLLSALAGNGGRIRWAHWIPFEMMMRDIRRTMQRLLPTRNHFRLTFVADALPSFRAFKLGERGDNRIAGALSLRKLETSVKTWYSGQE